MEYCLVYVTAPSAAEALRLGRLAVTEGLAGCANVLPQMTAIYVWEGQLCEEAEAVLVLKTPAARVEALLARLKGAHPYTCPCLVAVPIVAGHAPFLAWLEERTTPAPPPPGGVSPSA
jgi:periplasmic divalent cation tolerance protein